MYISRYLKLHLPSSSLVEVDVQPKLFCRSVKTEQSAELTSVASTLSLHPLSSFLPHSLPLPQSRR